MAREIIDLNPPEKHTYVATSVNDHSHEHGTLTQLWHTAILITLFFLIKFFHVKLPRSLLSARAEIMSFLREMLIESGSTVRTILLNRLMYSNESFEII